MNQCNFVLKKWDMNDKESLAYYANNAKIADNLRNIFPYPYTVDDASSYIKMCIMDSKPPKCVRAITVEGKTVGSIGIFLKDDVYCKSAEIGYWLGEEFGEKE